MKQDRNADFSGKWLKNALIPLCVAALSILSTHAGAQTLVSRWRSASAGNSGNRTMAYNPTTDHLLLVRNTTIVRFKAADGTSGGAAMNVTGVSGGVPLPLCGIAVDESGVIYGCNYVTAGTTNVAKIYKWTSESAAPSLLWSKNISTGSGNVGGVLSVHGTGTDAVFILGGTATNGVFVYNDGTQWTSKDLFIATAASTALTSGAKFIDYNNGGSGKFRILAKTGQIGGQLYSFDPTAPSPITLTVDKAYGAPLNFLANGVHGVDYDPVTGLIGACTRVNTSTLVYTNLLITTVGGAGTNIANPVLLATDQPPLASAGDSGSVGGVAWGKGALFTSASAVGAGINAYDITAFKVSDPVDTDNVTGTNATFSVVSGGSSLTYQWYANGVAITDGLKYSGFNSSTLTVSNLAAADAGTYYCVISGPSSSTWTSAEATLTVSEPAPPPTKFESVSRDLDGTVHLVISSANGSSFWVERTSDFVTWDQVSFVTIATGTSLEVTDSPGADQQFYRTKP